MKDVLPLRGLSAALLIGLAAPAFAQESAEVPEQAASGAAIEPDQVPMPNLAFQPRASDVRNFDKYFYFHRADTDFATAYADLQECDGYARGLPRNEVMPNAPVPYPYGGTVAGAVGGVLGNMLAGAIVSAEASAQRRRQRRSIMRTCMGFKGYQAYGLPRRLWREFNFEEGSRQVPEDERQRLLRMQARAASGPTPTVGEIGR